MVKLILIRIIKSEDVVLGQDISDLWPSDTSSTSPEVYDSQTIHSYTIGG